jgi:hypothetical protein
MLIDTQAKYAGIERRRVNVASAKFAASNVCCKLYGVQILQGTLPAYKR